MCYGFTGSLTIPNSVISIGEYAFYYCYSFTGSLTIPNSVTSIGEYAFYSCYGLAGSLTIPNSVTSIDRNAFGNNDFSSIAVDPNNPYCYSEGNAIIRKSDKVLLVGCKNTVIPNDINGIGDYAFLGCSGMTGSLTIPNSVTSIGDYAFYGCSNLQSLQVEAFNPPIIGNHTFDYIDKTIPVTVPCGSLSAYQTAPYWRDFTNIREEIFFTLSVSSANDDMGSATITQQPDCINDAIVTATPNQGFVFVNWTKNGEVVSTEAIYTFTLTENTVLVANFRQGTGVEENDAASSANFAYFSNGELVISCEGKNTLHIIDMMGRVLCSQTINGGCRICTNWMTAGTYILNLNGMTQKIVVK
ncbi:MAG: leucine-rich repeat domain-containing protein [bacterium]|nr:leucine-rich repeat domain-containing protein [Candidatus Limimorpha equi]